MMNRFAKYLTGIICLFLISANLTAQEDDGDKQIGNQNVTVLTDYTPEISESFRIEKLPEIIDTIKVEPEFEYKIYSKKMIADYNPDPLSAAKLKSEPKDVLENGYAKLALGSKLMLDGEIHYNNTRSNDLNWGINGRHKSGHGSIDNRVQDKVFAGYNRNQLGVFGKKMFSETTLRGSAGFKSNQHFFYGYNNETLPIDSAPTSRSDFKEMTQMQRYNLVSVRTEASSHYNHSKKLNYKVSLDYDYWFDSEDNMEHDLRFDLGLDKKIKKELIGIDAKLRLLPASFMDSTRMFISFDPYLAHNSENFKVKLGLHAKGRFQGDSTSYHFYPDVTIEHNIADVVLPYFSFSGDLSPHSANSLTRVNPYLNDANKIFPVRETNTKQRIVVGIKGRISEEVQFNFNGKYIKKDDEIFFINDYSDNLYNRFNIIYSDIEMFNAYGEISFDFPRSFNMRLYGNYNHFTWLKDIDKPYHVPDIEIGAFASLRVVPQLRVYSDASLMFGRYSFDPTKMENLELDPVIDVNLGAEYIVSQQLRAFMELNNLASQNYEIWNHYPVYGFHAMAGISYSF